MRYDYNIELNNILNKLYKEMIYNTLLNQDTLEISENNIEKIKQLLLDKKVYLGSDMDDFILKCIPDGHDGDLFRVSIAKHHKHLHPIFETQSGEVFVDPTYNSFGLLLFKNHMHDLLIDDVQSLFSQSGYESFINGSIHEFIKDIIDRINNYKNNVSPIVIKYDEKKYLLNVVKNMIDRKELSMELAYKLVDLDKLRDYMVKMAVTFEYYDEFDKFQEDTRFCLDNFCKYDAFKLYDFLVEEEGFELLEDGVLIKK